MSESNSSEYSDKPTLDEFLARHPQAHRVQIVMKLSNHLWDDPKEDWFPEDTWADRLAKPCNGDAELIAEIIQHAHDCQNETGDFTDFFAEFGLSELSPRRRCRRSR